MSCVRVNETLQTHMPSPNFRLRRDPRTSARNSFKTS